MHTPPVFTSPPLPTPPTPVLIFPLSSQIQAYVQQFDTLQDLLLLPPFHTYPLNRILSPGLPPFDSVALTHFLTSSHLRKLCFLKAYFHGWELYQAITAALVFFEDANSVVMLAFGSISSYKQLFVFSFSSASDTFEYALLIQQIPPPPSLQAILTKAHDVWHLPPYLSLLMSLCSSPFPPLLFSMKSPHKPILLPFLRLLDLPLPPFSFPLPHYLNTHAPFSSLLRILLCGVLLRLLLSRATSPSFVMLNTGYTSTTNIKKHMSFLLSLSSYSPASLLALFPHPLPSFFVLLIQSHLLTQFLLHYALTFSFLILTLTSLSNITLSLWHVPPNSSLSSILRHLCRTLFPTHNAAPISPLLPTTIVGPATITCRHLCPS